MCNIPRYNRKKNFGKAYINIHTTRSETLFPKHRTQILRVQTFQPQIKETSAVYGEINSNVQAKYSKQFHYYDGGDKHFAALFPLEKGDAYVLKYRQGHSVIKPYTVVHNPTLTTANQENNSRVRHSP